jgi:hypothetical protein
VHAPTVILNSSAGLTGLTGKRRFKRGAGEVTGAKSKAERTGQKKHQERQQRALGKSNISDGAASSIDDALAT